MGNGRANLLQSCAPGGRRWRATQARHGDADVGVDVVALPHHGRSRRNGARQLPLDCQQLVQVHVDAAAVAAARPCRGQKLLRDRAAAGCAGRQRACRASDVPGGDSQWQRTGPAQPGRSCCLGRIRSDPEQLLQALGGLDRRSQERTGNRGAGLWGAVLRLVALGWAGSHRGELGWAGRPLSAHARGRVLRWRGRSGGRGLGQHLAGCCHLMRLPLAAFLLEAVLLEVALHLRHACAVQGGEVSSKGWREPTNTGGE